MKNTIIDLLRSPDDKTALQFDEHRQQLISVESDFQYPILEGVPILLPQNAYDITAITAQHKNANTSFKYIDHYQKDAEQIDYFRTTIDAATLHENRRLHESILAQVPTTAKTILDVGCGKAWVAKHFQATDIQVISFDISTTNTTKALKSYPNEHHAAVVGDVFSLPFKANSIDCIIAAEIIEHVPHPSTFISSLLKALKSNGKLIITTPYKEQIQQHLCIHCNCLTPSHAHLHSFDEAKLLAAVKEAVKSKQSYVFSNKVLARLQTHRLLRYLPFKLWKWIDNLFNWLFGRQARLMLVVEQ